MFALTYVCKFIHHNYHNMYVFEYYDYFCIYLVGFKVMYYILWAEMQDFCQIFYNMIKTSEAMTSSTH